MYKLIWREKTMCAGDPSFSEAVTENLTKAGFPPLEGFIWAGFFQTFIQELPS